MAPALLVLVCTLFMAIPVEASVSQAAVAAECAYGSGHSGGPELCNDLDDDCDARVDEDWPSLGTSCSVGVGASKRAGIMVCAADGAGVECGVDEGSADHIVLAAAANVAPRDGSGPGLAALVSAVFSRSSLVIVSLLLVVIAIVLVNLPASRPAHRRRLRHRSSARGVASGTFFKISGGQGAHLRSS